MGLRVRSPGWQGINENNNRCFVCAEVESGGGSEGGLATVFGEMIDDFSLMWLIYKEMDAKFEICEKKYPIDNANIICKHA